MALTRLRFSNFYATIIYCFTTPPNFTRSILKLADPGDFEFEAFDDFKLYVQDENLEFKTKTEKELEDLLTASKEDNLEAIISEQVGDILALVEKEKEDDLTQYQEEITNLLENEIVSRYYYQTGKIKKSLLNDAEIKRAIDILEDPVVYANLLGEK